MIQPLSLNNIEQTVPDLHQVGCLGKIVSFKETENGLYLIELKGMVRFEIINEIKSKKNTENVKLILNVSIMILMIKKNS